MFECFTPDGKLQFNASAPQYVLVDKGTVLAKDVYVSGRYWNTAAPLPETFDAVAVSCTVAYATSTPGGVITQSCQGPTIDGIAPPTGLTQHSVDWWGFKRSDKILPSGLSGLVIFDAEGKLIYDSNYKIPSIGSILNKEISDMSISDKLSFSSPSACLTLAPGINNSYRIGPLPGDGMQTQWAAKKDSATNKFIFDTVRLSDGDIFSPIYERCCYAVVDISRL